MMNIISASQHAENDALWMQGLLRYQSCGYTRPPSYHKVVWQKDQVQCYALHSQHDDARPSMLWIPSLINRYYILDMNDELSLLRFLASSDMNIYVIDWHHPDAAQAHLVSADYISMYLLPLIDALSADMPIHLAGYCVGGMLAMAAAQLKADQVASLSLLATPWDFSQMGDMVQHPLCAGAVQQTLNARAPLVHGAYINWLFYLMNPEKFKAKYADFAKMREGSSEYQRFVMVEHWVNDAVALSQAFAKECLLDWVQHNQTMHEGWSVNGITINPTLIRCPTFIAAPRKDEIVPPESVKPLAQMITHSHYVTPDAGHIGMMVGKNRKKALWNPLRDFVRSCAAA